MITFLKRVLFITFVNVIDHFIAGLVLNIFIVLPLTFLTYSLYVYRSNKNVNSSEAFLVGLYIDLISETYFGLNALIFCLITYTINLYSNAFKLFSYLQICLFFGISATAYVGFIQLVENLYNFSYLVLLISGPINILFCTLIALISLYFPKSLNKNF